MRKLLFVFLSTNMLWWACKPQIKVENAQIFRYNQESGIATLDPAFDRDQSTSWAVKMLFNGLLQLDSNLQALPALAESWEVQNDGKTYRFKLRSAVWFHENKCFEPLKTRKVTASDFVYSFNRIIDPSLASPGAWIFSGKLASDPFRTVGDSVFEIHLNQAYPPLPGLLSMGYCSVVPHEAVSYYGADFRQFPVGTGPFQLAFWEENEALVLHRNPLYFEKDEAGGALPYLDAVQVSFLPDKQSAFLAFLQGKLDFISGVDPAFKDEVLQGDGSLQPKYADRIVLQRSPYLNTEYLGFLLDPAQKAAHPQLQNKKVRQALNLAIDRVSMMRYLRNNVGSAGLAGLLPPALPGFDSAYLNHYAYQPSEAKRLLREAGIEPGSLRIALETSPSYLDICIYIQRQWQDIGVKLDIQTSPGPTLRQLISKGEASLFRASWIADYPDAENYLALAYGPNAAPAGPNYTRFNHPEFNRLYEKSLQTPNDVERLAMYQRMNALLIDEAPFVVLFYDQVLRLVQPQVQGLSTNAMNMLDLRRVQLLR